ncbi:MAG: serine hydrolase domain-containing protein, partial [Gemmatimonadota bacterium]
MCRTVPSALVLLCLAAGDLAAQAVRSLTPTQVARLDSAVAAVLEEHEAVGLQVAVGLGDRVAWGGWAGMADLEHEVPVTPETRFRTASITKWMTATAAMRLAEQGKLDLDAPVQRYCPTYPEKRWTLTARHLLSHRGGVRHYWGANDESRETPAQRAEIERRSEEERLWQIVRYGDVVRPVERFEDDSLLFEPGTRYHYSSLGYRLLGCVLRGAAVDSYDDLMEELVFRPAGMVHTRPDDAHAIIPGRAMGYVRRGNRLERSRFRDVSENLPAGGHVSSAADLVRFALAWNRGALVSEESRRRMAAPPESEPDAESYYGYGVNVRQTPGRTFLSHGGGQDATRTLLVLLPDEEIAVAAMTNYESIEDGLTELVERALAIVAGGEPSAAEPEPGPPSPSRSGNRRDAPGT